MLLLRERRTQHQRWLCRNDKKGALFRASALAQWCLQGMWTSARDGAVVNASATHCCRSAWDSLSSACRWRPRFERLSPSRRRCMLLLLTSRLSTSRAPRTYRHRGGRADDRANGADASMQGEAMFEQKRVTNAITRPHRHVEEVDGEDAREANSQCRRSPTQRKVDKQNKHEYW